MTATFYTAAGPVACEPGRLRLSVATLTVLADVGDRYAREMRRYAWDGWTWTARDLLANSLDGRTPNLGDL